MNRIRLTEAPKKIPDLNVLKLWVLAGGRCEFNGCNDYLLRDKLTLKEANFSNIGHIVARTKNGPRGYDPMPFGRRNDIGNLMLLCTKCHKLIDDRGLEDQFPKELLVQYKKEHEERVLRLTGLQPENKTTTLVFKANIAGEPVQVSPESVYSAVHPRYPVDSDGFLIDLTSLPAPDDKDFYSIGVRKISETVSSLYKQGLNGASAKHISVFALGPMPLLVHLGASLSNKVPTDLYQFHRDTQDWSWKKNGAQMKYKLRRLQKEQNDKVALLLSLSGTIDQKELPQPVRDDFTIYEITLAGTKPNPMFLDTRETLRNFEKIYQSFLRDLGKYHSNLSELHLFPAVPAPIAVACGRGLLLKVDPVLVVYDYQNKKFNSTLKVSKT